MHTDCCSDQVKIIFSSLRNTICDIADKAFTWQGRRVTGEIVEIVSCSALYHLTTFPYS